MGFFDWTIILYHTMILLVIFWIVLNHIEKILRRKHKMVKLKVVSPRNSLKNWKFPEWFRGNWKTVREILKVGIPYGVAYLATNNHVASGILALVGKCLLDTGQFYFKEITKKE